MPTVEWTEPRRVTPLWFSLFFLFSLANCHQINSKIPIEKKKKNWGWIRIESIYGWCICWVFSQFSSVAQPCPTFCDPLDGITPGFSVHHQFLELAQNHVQWVGDAILPSYPLSSPSPPVFNLSQHQGLFQWVSSSHQVPKYWSFTISPSSEYSALISFRIDWFDLLEVQGPLKSLLQNHGSKASILRHSAFFMVQLWHAYMTTEKPQLWLNGPLSAICFCFLICCLVLS